MPSRKIPKNYRSVTGTFPSFKNNSNISYESLLERDFYLLLEFNEEVASYEEQPFTIQYTRNDRKYNYTPDVLVHYQKHLTKLPCVFEIKMSSEIKEKKVFFEEKFNQVESYINDNDLDFKIFTELEIDEIYLENALFLYRYRTLQNTSNLNYIIECCGQYKEIEVKEILSKLSSNTYEQLEYLPCVWHLVFTKQLLIDMSTKITNSSILKVNHGKT